MPQFPRPSKAQLRGLIWLMVLALVVLLPATDPTPQQVAVIAASR